ncbi:type II toxin-antitoxin system VapC family toxin [Candidatus Woesearchaeota archaeon]|nr:type II toxin-antitoxin system VapC family toxin [Candidatus Woesearchaeota archaeon]
MSLVLDSSVIISIERGDKKTIEELKKLSRHYSGPASIPFIARFEFMLGILEKNPKNKKESIALLNKFRTLPITNYTADILSELKYKYDNKGISLPLADLLIAAQAIEHKACLITSDRHFERIEELQAIFI